MLIVLHVREMHVGFSDGSSSSTCLQLAREHLDDVPLSGLGSARQSLRQGLVQRVLIGP
jgi:hypothetical protein